MSFTSFCLLASAFARLSVAGIDHAHDHDVSISKLALLNSPNLLRNQDRDDKTQAQAQSQTQASLRVSPSTTPSTITTTLPKDYVCEHPPYEVHIFSKSPLVMYLSGFLSDFERSHLMNVSAGSYSRSFVVNSNGTEVESNVRMSESAIMDPEDEVVRCIEERAADFQGLDMPMEHLEITQMVRYAKNGHYSWHTDWFEDHVKSTASHGGNRISSFFVYVDVGPDTLGGGTNFPVLDPPSDRRWCDRGYIDCDDSYASGVTFSPQAGNGIFWDNLFHDSTKRGETRGDYRVLHAGFPVLRGSKTGMNIWTREARLPEYVEEDGRH